jgi:hypothetical protein
MSIPKKDIEPDVEIEDDDEPSLPQAEDTMSRHFRRRKSQKHR